MLHYALCIQLTGIVILTYRVYVVLETLTVLLSLMITDAFHCERFCILGVMLFCLSVGSSNVLCDQALPIT